MAIVIIMESIAIPDWGIIGNVDGSLNCQEIEDFAL